MSDRFAGKATWFDAHYDTTRGRVRLALVLERLRAALPPPPAKILDAGGGTGAFALPLAGDGYAVTVLDASREWLEVARVRSEASGLTLDLLHGRLEDARELVETGFDAVCCHGVLMYGTDPVGTLGILRSLAHERGVLSLLEKNQHGIAFRPGLQGDYAEARRLLEASASVGRLGIENRAYEPSVWENMLVEGGWHLADWAGVRLFSDLAPDDLPDADFDALLALERDAGVREPFRRVARLIHLIASAS